jgi:ABC-type sugar transport system ATPase subunit
MSVTTAEKDAVITFDHVEKTFPGHRAVQGLDFTITRGELVSVVA